MSTITAPRETIAIDIDEVLGAFLESLCLHINVLGFEASSGVVSQISEDSVSSSTASSTVVVSKTVSSKSTPWTPEDFTSYHFNDAWGIDETTAHSTMTRFFSSSHFAEIKPLLGAKEVLLKHKQKFRFIVVTSRNSNLGDQTRKWLNEHFDECFDDVMFGSAYGPGVRRTKSEMCKEIQAIMLVDDNPYYAAEASPALKTSVLFGDYAWNRETTTTSKNIQLPQNLVRVQDWKTLDRVLTTLFERRELFEKLHNVQAKARSMIDNVSSAVDSANNNKKKNLIDIERETHEIINSLLLAVDIEPAINRAEEFLSLISL
jgi:hypothetical protein